MSFTFVESRAAKHRMQAGAVLLILLGGGLLWLSVRLFARDWWAIASIGIGGVGALLALVGLVVLLVASTTSPAR